MPGRRGKPSGVGPVLRSTTNPAGAASSRCGEPLRDGAHGLQRRRVGPTQSTTAPPGRTSGRHHSAATGGGASAFASAQPGPVDLLLLGAAPHDARVRRCVLAQEVALARLRLEQHELPLRQRERERDPRRAAAGADVHDRALPRAARARARAASRRAAPAAPPRVADRGQPGRRDDGPEPALRVGLTTT